MKKRGFFYDSHSNVFDGIDTNGDGHISVKEFKVYLKVVAPNLTGSSQACF